MVFSFSKAVLFFFQGKEVINLFGISETKRRKKEMKKKKKKKKKKEYKKL